jgi:hypothetical protein
MTRSNKIFLGVIAAVALVVGWGVLQGGVLQSQSPTDLCSKPEVVATLKKLNVFMLIYGEQLPLSDFGGQALEHGTYKCVANVEIPAVGPNNKPQVFKKLLTYKLEMDNGSFLVTALN